MLKTCFSSLQGRGGRCCSVGHGFFFLGALDSRGSRTCCRLHPFRGRELPSFEAVPLVLTRLHCVQHTQASLRFPCSAQIRGGGNGCGAGSSKLTTATGDSMWMQHEPGENKWQQQCMLYNTYLHNYSRLAIQQYCKIHEDLNQGDQTGSSSACCTCTITADCNTAVS